MIDSIIAVVVTFNRKKYLLKCLQALELQTYKLNEIIIIDNASTDGTKEFLKENGIFDTPCYRYVQLEKNTGGAGGFNAGMSIALKTNTDWLWVMDDDVAPDKNCLQELIMYKKISECIHPRKILDDGNDYIWEHQIDILTGGKTLINNQSFKNGKSVVFTNVACFEGMLVSRRIVEKIGLPDSKYFISDDDTLFGIKASIHTNVAYVSSAIIRKLIPLGMISDWKSYYLMRNKFYLFRDACEYMDLRPSWSDQLFFILMRLLELLRLIKLGKSFAMPAIRGFTEGFSYMHRGR